MERVKIIFKVRLRVKTGSKYNEKRKMVSHFKNLNWKKE
jgi:hypothetical protein